MLYHHHHHCYQSLRKEQQRIFNEREFFAQYELTKSKTSADDGVGKSDH